MPNSRPSLHAAALSACVLFAGQLAHAAPAVTVEVDARDAPRGKAAAQRANIVPGSPADLAGIAPGSHLIAVDGRKYSKEGLQDVLNAGGADARVIKLLIAKDDMFSTVDVRYAGKSRYPRLERDAATPDLLSLILAPRAP